VICHNLNLQRRLLTQQLGEHRPESSHDRVTVADPGTSVDDQQDSFSYGHSMIFRFTKTSPLSYPLSESNSKASWIYVGLQASGFSENKKLERRDRLERNRRFAERLEGSRVFLYAAEGETAATKKA
jgi:hypothetical protein